MVAHPPRTFHHAPGLCWSPCCLLANCVAGFLQGSDGCPFVRSHLPGLRVELDKVPETASLSAARPKVAGLTRRELQWLSADASSLLLPVPTVNLVGDCITNKDQRVSCQHVNALVRNACRLLTVKKRTAGDQHKNSTIMSVVLAERSVV